MATQTIRVKGLKELVRDFGKMDKQLKKDLQNEIKEVAGIVSDEARNRAQRFGPVVAGKIRPRARGARGYAESNARSKHLRPDFGALIVRSSLLPALDAKQGEVIKALDDMLGRLGGDYGF